MQRPKPTALLALVLVFLAAGLLVVGYRFKSARQAGRKFRPRAKVYSSSSAEAEKQERWWVTEKVTGKPYLQNGLYFLPLSRARLVLGGKNGLLGVAWVTEPQKCDLGQGAFWQNEEITQVLARIEPGMTVKFLLTTGIEPGFLEQVQQSPRCRPDCQQRIKLLSQHLPFNRAYIEAVNQGRKFSQTIGPPDQIMFCPAD